MSQINPVVLHKGVMFCATSKDGVVGVVVLDVADGGDHAAVKLVGWEPFTDDLLAMLARCPGTRQSLRAFARKHRLPKVTHAEWHAARELVGSDG